jgi:hypothetical protein
LAIGNFINDRRLDFVTVSRGGQNMSVYLPTGNGSFISVQTYAAGAESASYAVAIGHFNDDSNLDFVTSHYSMSTMSVFLGHGDGTFENALTTFISIEEFDPTSEANSDIYEAGSSSELIGMAVGEFNRDRKTDLIVVFSAASGIGEFLGNKDGSF